VTWPPRWLTHDVEQVSHKAQLALDFIDVFGVVTKDSVAGRAKNETDSAGLATGPDS